MGKHTEGPWEISQNANGDYDICTTGGGDMLADLSGCSNAQANAQLIAAAPELLAALQALRRVIPADFNMGPEGAKAAEAIAKATGNV